MEKLEEKEKMSEGLSVADAMSLGNNNGFGDQIWPLIYLSALGGGNGGILGGGRNDAAAGVTVAGIEGLQNQINGLLNTINSNTSVLQHEAVQTQLCNMATLIQSGNADITQAICDCCCKTQAAICDLGYKIDNSNASILNAICAQTGHIDMALVQQTMQNTANTRLITDGQLKVIESQREGTSAILERLNQQENSELREKNSTLQSQLDKQEIITALSGS